MGQAQIHKMERYIADCLRPVIMCLNRHQLVHLLPVRLWYWYRHCAANIGHVHIVNHADQRPFNFGVEIACILVVGVLVYIYLRLVLAEIASLASVVVSNLRAWDICVGRDLPFRS